ncbi:periplasmic binding protein/LacI transcriptional regulator [Beijerinckia indica subsp. indica ATCC 9039]|uniref:Periplasmic binding protein/LacI transcriptional regulator n=2 Tax=Beijerinckia TaxID=532 RepID=B2IKB2_BEII9|nr:periplasmic binding protein/LacI transcriptional regulator [Beijerinckia indica subsp. indica ATCC 9039]
MSLFDDNYLTVLRQAMENYAKTKGDVTVRSEDAQGDIARQQSQIDNFIASGVNAIIVMLVDADSSAAISSQAEAAGVPLVFVNQAPVNDLPTKQAFVGSDEVLAGNMQGQEVCKELKGTGKVVILEGQLGTTGQRGRTEGVHQALSAPACKNIKIVDEKTANWMRTPAMDLVTNWISAGLDFNAVLANNDEMALGAVQALKASGRPMNSVVIAGSDATKDALAAMKAGDLGVTVFQNATGQGKGAIDAALKLAKGEAVPNKTYIPFELVTKDNMDKYLNRN